MKWRLILSGRRGKNEGENGFFAAVFSSGKTTDFFIVLREKVVKVIFKG